MPLILAEVDSGATAMTPDLPPPLAPEGRPDAEPIARPWRVRQFFAELGPGLITGAADDDPSGISTYSVAGATFGYAPLWTALFSFPLMAAVQLMCARLGMVSGRGLASVIRQHYSRRVLWSACALLVVANVINIGADLGGMAEVSEMVTGVKAFIWTPIYAGFIVSLLLWSSYRRIARIFKWLTLVLFAYVLAAFLARPDWGALAGAGAYWLFALGLIGTGMLGVPVLAGSCAYAVAEAEGWRGSLDDTPRLARRFYAVVAVAMLVGLVLNYVGLDAVTMLFWSAVVNGVLAAPLIVLVVLLTSDRAVMGKRVNPPLLRWLGWATAVIMTAATV